MMVVVLVLLLILVVMMVVVLVLLLILVVMVMVVLVLLLILIVMMLVFILFLVGGEYFLEKLLLQIGSSLDRVEDHLSIELGNGSRNDGRILVEGPQEFDTLIDLFLADLVRPGKDDRPGIGDLIVEKLAEILEIDLAFGGIHHCHGAVEMHLRMLGGIVDGAHDIRELADT